MRSILWKKLRIVWSATLISLLMCLIFDFIGGTFLGAYFHKMMTGYPLILIILPGLMGLRGNIFGAMASRFTTALYMGEMEPKLTDENVLRGIVLSVLLSITPIFILWVIGMLRLGDVYSAVVILIIVISSTIFVSLLLGFSTAIVTIEPFKRDIDPDMVAAPLITSMADLLTIPMLIAFVILYEVNSLTFYTFFGVLTVTVLILFVHTKFRARDWKIFFEILGVLAMLAVVQSITGNILEVYSDAIYASVLFSVAYPAVLDTLGNYGAIIAAKTSTNLHLGTIEKFLDKETISDIFSLFTTSFVVSLLINVIGIAVTMAIIKRKTSLILPFLILFPVVSVFVMLLAYVFAILFHRFNVDPDNVTVPTITTLADLIGTVFVVLIARLI